MYMYPEYQVALVDIVKHVVSGQLHLLSPSEVSCRPLNPLQWCNPSCSITGRQITCYIRGYAILGYWWP